MVPSTPRPKPQPCREGHLRRLVPRAHRRTLLASPPAAPRSPPRCAERTALPVPPIATELLAPVLAKDGLYLATNREPPSSAPEPSTDHWTAYEGVRFDELLHAAPELYGKVQVIRVDYSAPKLNLDGKVDLVLMMREVHMMKNWGTLDTWLREIHRALKRNGILGVEEHRAAPGTDPEKCAATAYLPEAWVIARVEAAGFKLVGRSEINANARDTRDHPKGAWTLPPELALGDVDRDRYLAIGESDRMTLKFVRVADGAAR